MDILKQRNKPVKGKQDEKISLPPVARLVMYSIGVFLSAKGILRMLYSIYAIPFSVGMGLAPIQPRVRCGEPDGGQPHPY